MMPPPRDRLTRLRYGIHEFFYTLMSFPRAWRFMRNHRLWVGLRQYGWVARALVVIGVFVGLFMISEVVDWYEEHTEAPLTALAIGEDSLLLLLVTDAYESLSDGVLNWIVLVLLEVVIYHFMRRTLQVVVGKEVEEAHKFKPFFDAQKRMLLVSLGSVTVQEILLELGDDLLPGFVSACFSLAVQATILGFAIADNYAEQFELTKTQSYRYFYRHYLGICMGLGLPLFLMLKVPVVGTLLGPLVTSVAAAIVLREKSDLHLVGYRMSEKEQRKADKKAAKRARKEARRAARRGSRATETT